MGKRSDVFQGIVLAFTCMNLGNEQKFLRIAPTRYLLYDARVYLLHGDVRYMYVTCKHRFMLRKIMFIITEGQAVSPYAIDMYSRPDCPSILQRSSLHVLSYVNGTSLSHFHVYD